MTDLTRFEKRLEALGKLALNVDLERREEFTASNGWHLDAYEADLPGEPSGEPLERGAFDAARSVLCEYRFPPPDLITGIFVPDGPLEGRVMLLRARFLIFTFYFGVRVNAVIDELREDVQERVWGYRYATLEGHFERGQIEFLIVKDLKTGAVQFRISAFSKTGVIRNPFYKIGFALFGRRLQVRFSQESLKRMQYLVTEALRTGQTVGSVPPIASASSEPAAQEKLEALTQTAQTVETPASRQP